MTMHIPQEDRPLTVQQIQGLSSADRLAEFFTYLGYPEGTRVPMTAEALDLNQRLKDVVQRVEQLASVDGALMIYLFKLTSVTVAHTRALARVFRNRAGNFLLVLTDDYRRLDFVLLERELPGQPGTGVSARQVLVHPRVLSVDRRDPDRVALRVLRRFTCTEIDPDGDRDPYAQYDKLRSAFTIAAWAEPYFNNVALFSDYYLNARLPELPAWNAPARNQAFRAVRKCVAEARRTVRQDAAQAPDALIRPILETLGFRVAPDGADDGADFLLHLDGGDEPAVCVLAYPWHRYLDGKDTQDPDRPEQNPGAQVVALLEAEVAPWAIVTNGKTWRLYSARAHSRATNYYEIDLEETLAAPDPGEAFRYFYLFFRAAAFTPEERAVAGETRTLSFVDWLLEESAAYARDLGQRLKTRVFEEIFPYFAEGFIASLGGPEALRALAKEERAKQLDAVYQATLTFLYRLLFLLYAESRDLLPVREVRGYYQISLRRMKEELATKAGLLEDQAPRLLENAYAADSTALYERLQDLFAVIDRGSKARNVPTYNGGLFITDPAPDDTRREAETARFLQRVPLPDRHLALGLDRLARDVDPKRGDLGLIDYKDLGVRQLGSIYEGLLEFKIRLTADGVALVGDKGERKATGSYYTPDYIVAYIVEQTVGPVLDEKLAALEPRLREAERRFHQAMQHKREVEGVAQPDAPALLQNVAGDVLRDLFDVKILDPAMGSGHFLVEAVDFVTDRLTRFLEGFRFMTTFFDGMRESIVTELQRQEVTVDLQQLTDLKLLKRHVLKRCIYGVDLNPMAVELAKVSLWLDCFTLGAPLSFLDHHLRCGNSLIGAMGRDVADEFAADMPLFGSGPFNGLLRAAQTIQQISANTDVTLDQVRESRSLYDVFEDEATPYKRLLDVRVARHFGVERADEFLRAHTPEQALNIVRGRADDVDPVYRKVVVQARALYDDKRFFHWDLEFPEVFIDLERADWKENGGFDAVVGNPPYATTGTLRATDMSAWRYYRSVYPSASSGKFDIYLPFLEKAWSLIQISGRAGYILPNKWLKSDAGVPLRRILVDQKAVDQIVDFGAEQVFPEITTYTCLCILSGNPADSISYTEANLPLINDDLSWKEISYRMLGERPWSVNAFLWSRFIGSESFLTLEEITSIFVGTSTNADDIFILENAKIKGDKISAFSPEEGKFIEIETEACVPFLRGREIDRYRVSDDSVVVILPYEKGTDRAKLLNAEEISSRYPKTWQYLNRHRSKLEARENGHWKSRNDWYCHAYPRNHGQINNRKLLSPDICNYGQWMLDAEGKYHCLNTVYGVSKSQDAYTLKFLLSLLNSNVFESFIRASSVDLRGGYYRVTKNFMSDFPIRRIHFTTPEAERERRVAELVARYERGEHAALLAAVEALLSKDADGDFLAFRPGATGAEDGTQECSDVVHDLLAHLAEQMIDLHKQKQARVDAFWADLEAATDAGTFEQLREHGKWEQSLAKAPACAPYVDADSRSTRHLDESLGWDADCYAAFVGLLAGKRAVTPAVERVYAAHAPAYSALVARIAATDRLIDEVVYRLYGLTEEEIAVVEGAS